MFHRTLISTIALVFTMLTAASVVQAQEPTLEPEYTTSSKRVTDDIAIAVAVMVQSVGYKCDSISALNPMIFSLGYTLYCNYFRYGYEIEDKGGQWIVTVQ